MMNAKHNTTSVSQAHKCSDYRVLVPTGDELERCIISSLRFYLKPRSSEITTNTQMGYFSSGASHHKSTINESATKR